MSSKVYARKFRPAFYQRCLWFWLAYGRRGESLYPSNGSAQGKGCICRAQLTKQASVFRFLLSQYLLVDLGVMALLLARNISYVELCNSPANLLPGQSCSRN